MVFYRTTISAASMTNVRADNGFRAGPRTADPSLMLNPLP